MGTSVPRSDAYMGSIEGREKKSSKLVGKHGALMASVYTLVIANTWCPISLRLQDQRLAVSNNHHLPSRVSGEAEPNRKGSNDRYLPLLARNRYQLGTVRYRAREGYHPVYRYPINISPGIRAGHIHSVTYTLWSHPRYPRAIYLQGTRVCNRESRITHG